MTRRLLIDVRPLRESPPFRRLWIGSGLSGVGSQMTVFAVAFQVFTLTHSSFAVGAVGLATALPAIALGLFGGSIADAVDRRDGVHRDDQLNLDLGGVRRRKRSPTSVRSGFWTSSSRCRPSSVRSTRRRGERSLPGCSRRSGSLPARRSTC